MFQWASAQNVPENPATARQASTLAVEANESAERERINQQSARLSTEYEAARAQCYQRFLVNACLADARDSHNKQQADLKRQENALNDIQRKRRGAEQLERTEEKQSPQRQQEIAEQRGKAIENSEKRDQRQSERAAAQGASAAKPGAIRDKSARAAPQARPSSQTNQASQQARANEKAASLQRKKANAAQARAEQGQRVKEAAAHRESVKNRQLKSKKPPAASLPLPAD